MMTLADMSIVNEELDRVEQMSGPQRKKTHVGWRRPQYLGRNFFFLHSDDEVVHCFSLSECRWSGLYHLECASSPVALNARESFEFERCLYGVQSLPHNHHNFFLAKVVQDVARSDSTQSKHTKSNNKSLTRTWRHMSTNQPPDYTSARPQSRHLCDHVRVSALPCWSAVSANLKGGPITTRRRIRPHNPSEFTNLPDSESH